MKSSDMHWNLPIQKKRTLHEQARNLVFNVNMESMKHHHLRKHIVKIHTNLCHKSEKQLIRLFRMAGKCTTKIRRIIKHVVETCDICTRFKKTPPRSCVAMPKAHTTNEVISDDLKEKSDFKK